jgi:hypothetical protein
MAKTITLKTAVSLATLSLTFQRQTYKFDSSMYDRGVYNNKTNHAKTQYDLITAAIDLLNSLVTGPAQQPAPGDTNQQEGK